jgi:hypothetical protein
MTTHVISLRLPAPVDVALRASAVDARLSVSAALDWLLRNSVENFELLRGLADCSERRRSKLDARIQIQTLERVSGACQRLGISISVYTRRLLYHFYVTKRVSYPQSNGHYTLAVRHD